MSRDNSPYIVGDHWLDKRRDGKSPNIWQIATSSKRTVLYRSTHSQDLNKAKAVLDAFVANLKSVSRQESRDAEVIPLLLAYWREHGAKTVNCDQAARSIRTFIGFLMHDQVGVRAVVTDLTPALFERFREWRMSQHQFQVPWSGKTITYSSQGVSGETVQRNLNDIRAAVHHAQANMRISVMPKIKDIDQRYRSAPRERILSVDEMAKIAWYAAHNPVLFRFVALQFATAVRPTAALKFDPRLQYKDGLIDLQPNQAPQTKKRNAVIPAIRPLRPILLAWAKEAPEPAASRKTAWRIMRRTLGLSDDVFPKTIRHTIATLLYADPSVPEREIVEMLGHEGNLVRTTRVYAKYDPHRLRNLTRSLTKLWLQVSRAARKFAADHLLTTGQRGDPFKIIRKIENTPNTGGLGGGRDRD